MSTELNAAPEKLDGACVIRYASLAGIAHLAKISASIDGVPTEPPAVVAVAAYPGEPGAYVFHCSPDWVVLAAGHYSSITLAVQRAEQGFPGVSGRWVVLSQAS